jgi:hypothetical protein
VFTKIDSYILAVLIQLQRTDIQKKFKSPLIIRIDKVLGGVLSLSRVLTQGLNTTRVINSYIQANKINVFDINTQISKLGFSKNDSFVIADIGSGIGGYHKEWLRNFPNSAALLIDQTKFSFTSLIYGHGKSERYYNNLTLAKKFLLQGGSVTPKQIHLMDTRNHDGEFGDCEIVISFISLGFHYPLDTYWDRIWSSSKVQILLLDIRINSQSENFLLEKLNLTFSAEKVSSSAKSHRWAVSRFNEELVNK